jgi:hypothetical protein
MRATLALLVSLLFVSATLSADCQNSARKVLGDRIAKGLMFQGRLWVSGTMTSRNDPTGALVSLDLNDSSETVHFVRGVLDFTTSNGQMWVLRCESLRNRDIVLSSWLNGGFQDIATFTVAPDDFPIAVLSGLNTPAVLTQQGIRLVSSSDHRIRLIKLRGKLRSGVQVSAIASGESVYVGYNIGEWGGGLQRIDLRTGVVENVERRDTNELCAGPLNSECDPVTGVVSDLRNDSCVLASVGLVHLGMTEGRILRVCGKNVDVASEFPVESDPIHKSMRMTEAFYGLVSGKDGGPWGITYRAIYHFDRDGNKEAVYPLPKLEPIAGIYLSREIPGVVVIRTDVNWAVSTSGYTPLVVPVE